MVKNKTKVSAINLNEVDVNSIVITDREDVEFYRKYLKL